MAIDKNDTPQRSSYRRLAVALAGFVTLGLAGVTAQAAMAAPKPRYLTPVRSVQVLDAAYGAKAERPISETKIVVAPTSAAILAFADTVNAANGARNPMTGRTWSTDDAKAMWPKGLDGFTDPSNGTIYVNGHSAVATTVPHELLHANSSPDFLKKLGVEVNEGVTHQLTLEALAAAGIKAEKVTTYPRERELAVALINVVGRDRLVAAYFNGGAALDDVISTIGGDQRVQGIVGAAATNHIGEAIRLVQAAQ